MITSNRIHAHFDPWTMWNKLHSGWNEIGSLNLSFAEAPLNVWAKDDAAIVRLELPGRRLEDIHVAVHRDVLKIEVCESAAESLEAAAAVRAERSRSHLTRNVRLPFDVDPERIEAIYERGLLNIHLHRHESTMPLKVNVAAG